MSVAVTIEMPQAAKLAEQLSRSPGVALKWLRKATAAGVFTIQKHATDVNFQFRTPRSLRTGMLLLSYGRGTYLSPSGLEGFIGPDLNMAPYAAMVYTGTRPHVIEAKNARVLANRKAGLIFGKRVQHPGSAPNPYPERIAKAATRDVQRLFNEAVAGMLKEINL